MEQRSSSCPQLENPNADDWMGVWDDDCSTAAGNHYFGTALYGADQISDEHIEVWIFNILCSFELTDPQGDTFIAGGEIEFKRERSDYEITLEARINGSFSYPPESDWLGRDTHASLFISGNIQNEKAMLNLYGGFSQNEQALFFDNLTLVDQDCGTTIIGRLSLRDPSHYWIHVDFEPCNPCAQVSWLDSSLGELCIGESLQDSLSNLAQETL